MSQSIEPGTATTQPPLAPLAEPLLAHAALEAVITIDEAQRIVMINPAGLSMFALTREQALGMELGQLLPKRLRHTHHRQVQDFRAHGPTERRMGERSQVLGVRATGEEFPLEVAIFKSEVQLPTGTQTYCTALLRDISEISRMSGVIEQLNLRLRSVFEQVPVAIWITESDRVVFANRACAQLVGLERPEQLVGQSIFELLLPESHEPMRTELRTIERRGTATVLYGTLKRSDDTLCEVEMVVAALPDHERRFVQMVISDITQRSREKQQLLQSRRTLRELSASLVEAREEERRRIARELHDELGQRLTALKLELNACQRDHPHPALNGRAQHMLDMLDDTVAAVRRISLDLRPLMLDDLGLPEAIDWLVKEFRQRTGTQVRVRLANDLHRLSPQLAIAFFRIVQEALTNITRHAQATRVSLVLERHAVAAAQDPRQRGQLPAQRPGPQPGLLRSARHPRTGTDAGRPGGGGQCAGRRCAPAGARSLAATACARPRRFAEGRAGVHLRGLRAWRQPGLKRSRS